MGLGLFRNFLFFRGVPRAEEAGRSLHAAAPCPTGASWTRNAWRKPGGSYSESSPSVPGQDGKGRATDGKTMGARGIKTRVSGDCHGAGLKGRDSASPWEYTG